VAKREQAREEARFMRGDVGVDGQATEETEDTAELERGKARDAFLRRKAYLGREFLTWLLWCSESAEPIVTHEGEPLSVILADKLVLRGIAGEVVELTARGAMAPYSPLIRRSLDRGLLIHQTRLRLMHGERTFEATVDAEHLDLKSAKLPELLSEEDDDQVMERLALSEHLSVLMNVLLEKFLRLRASKKWLKETVPEMKAWMSRVEPPQRAGRVA
jgi:hypothetical protein